MGFAVDYWLVVFGFQYMLLVVNECCRLNVRFVGLWAYRAYSFALMFSPLDSFVEPPSSNLLHFTSLVGSACTTMLRPYIMAQCATLVCVSVMMYVGVCVVSRRGFVLILTIAVLHPACTKVVSLCQGAWRWTLGKPAHDENNCPGPHTQPSNISFHLAAWTAIKRLWL